MATTPKTESSAGTTIGISSGVPQAITAEGLAQLEYLPIGKIKNAGEFGKQFQLITSQYLTERGEGKRKGTWNAGQLPLQVDRISTAGQEKAEEALDSDADYFFRIKLQSGKTFYVMGLVTAFRTSIGGPNENVSGTIQVELNPMTLGDGSQVAAIAVPAAAPAPAPEGG